MVSSQQFTTFTIPYNPKCILRKSVLITGASGYVGRIALAELMKSKGNMKTVVAHDVRIPKKEEQLPGVIYVEGDIRDKKLSDIIVTHQIDTVVHLVSIVTRQKGEGRAFAYSVDVDGTRNLLEACIEHKVKKFIMTSSGAVYGYYADNPEWLTEQDPLRGNPEFAYSDHKRIQEELLGTYRQDHPELQQLVFRPGTIIGETTDNQIVDMFARPVIIGINGSTIPFVFIWDVDMARIIIKGICEENEGIYNVAGDGALTLRQLAERTGKRYLSVPIWVLKMILSIMHLLGFAQNGPEQLSFLQYRPLLLNKALKERFGYIPTFTSAQAFDYYLERNLKLEQTLKTN